MKAARAQRRLFAATRERTLVTLMSGAIVALLVAASASAAPTRTFTYQVDDETYGPVGTISFVVETQGDTTVVTTEAHIVVTVLGITLYRQESTRRERWVGSRLVEFRGVTNENGTAVQIDGRADGEHFVLVSPSGETRTPGTIRPASPLTADRGGGPVFLPDTGIVTTAQVEDLGEVAVTLDGTATTARRYRIETAGAKQRYEVWMGAERTPLRFSVKDARSADMFTLVR
ncbi:MAG: hypothetical protein JWM77_538 [Rhodospirillales bacterium]|nr:hypothetical protein [Rhodospirillales bacterium]